MNASRRDFLRLGSAGLLAMGSISSLPAFANGTQPAVVGSANDAVIYLYDRMSALDAIGPYEVLRCVPGMRVLFAAKNAGLVRTDSGLQMLNAEYGIADIRSADILVIPGGDASGPINDPEVLQWIRAVNETTKWTASSCTGALVLGAAGLLKGVRATTHWNTMEALPHFGAVPVNRRFVRDGKIITSAGVSAGIDMALELVALTHGEQMAKMVQLVIEYDPQPPFESGSRGKATAETIQQARERIAAIYAK